VLPCHVQDPPGRTSQSRRQDFPFFHSLNFFILHPQPADVNQNSSESHKAYLSLGSYVIEPGGLAYLEALFINVTVDTVITDLVLFGMCFEQSQLHLRR
jgi:hypothetical protein